MKAYTANPSVIAHSLIRKVTVIVIAIILVLVCCSCGSTKAIQMVPLETSKEVSIHDTIYLSNVQYDSVYVSRDLFTDRTRDTLLIRETNTEYRYRHLRDTVERIKIEVLRDSIPYEVRVVETKEIARPLTFFDRLCRACFYLLLGALLVLFLIFLFKLKNRIRL